MSIQITETFYPSSDDSIYASAATWAGVIAASTGTLRGGSDANCQNSELGSLFYCERGFFHFDTANIGTGATIDSATLTLYCRVNEQGSFEMNIYESTATDTVVANDFDLVGSTAYCDTAVTTWVADETRDWAFNSTGLSNITQDGISKFATRGHRDVDGTPDPADEVINAMSTTTSETTGTNKDPVLSVTYTIADDIKSHSTLTTSLVSYWDLEEASGTRYDLHGSNDLTDQNTVGQAAGKNFGNGADFEATNTERLDISDGSQSGLDITGDMSISVWVKVESQPATNTQYDLVSKWDSGQRQYRLNYRDDSGTLSLDLEIASACGTGPAVKSINQTLSNGTWYHVVAVYDASAGTWDLYVDNSSVGQATGLNTSIANCTGTFCLGALQSSGANPFDGVLDEVGIWSKTLTTDEISDLYNGGSGLPYWAPDDVKNESTLSTSLTSYWEMEQSAGATATDSHASNDGTDNGTVGSTTGILSNAGDYDGSADYHQVSDNADMSPTSDFAWSMWLNPDTLPTSAGARGLVEKVVGAGDNRSYLLSYDYGNGDASDVTWRVLTNPDGTGAGNTTAYSSAANFNLTTGSWQHVVFNYDASAGSITIYLDGVREAVITGLDTSIYDGTAPVNIGASPNALAGYHNGGIDEVSYWKGKVLTIGEVRALYSYGSPPPYEAAAAEAAAVTPTPTLLTLGAG